LVLSAPKIYRYLACQRHDKCYDMNVEKVEVYDLRHIEYKMSIEDIYTMVGAESI
jgi:hypothetical protein